MVVGVGYVLLEVFENFYECGLYFILIYWFDKINKLMDVDMN